jgi:hypothetical protein
MSRIDLVQIFPILDPSSGRLVKKSKNNRNSPAPERHAVFCEHPVQRPNYFQGQLLGADDLRAEQEYHRNKLRRHNLHCHGVGVVDGLEVSANKDADGWSVVVEPGLAIDPMGNEIHLCEPARFPLPESVTALQVGIQFTERLSGAVPVIGGEPEPETMFTRVEEGCEVLLQPLPSTRAQPTHGCNDALGDVLVLARLVRRGHAWRMDRRFKVQRAR